MRAAEGGTAIRGEALPPLPAYPAATRTAPGVSSPARGTGSSLVGPCSAWRASHGTASGSSTWRASPRKAARVTTHEDRDEVEENIHPHASGATSCSPATIPGGAKKAMNSPSGRIQRLRESSRTFPAMHPRPYFSLPTRGSAGHEDRGRAARAHFSRPSAWRGRARDAIATNMFMVGFAWPLAPAVSRAAIWRRSA